MNPRPDNAATPRPVNFVHPQDGVFPRLEPPSEGSDEYMTLDFWGGSEERACPCYEGFTLRDNPIDSSV